MKNKKNEAKKYKKEKNLEERRKKNETKRAKFKENNLHHFEKEIESYSGLENLLNNKFNHSPIELDFKITEKYISVNYNNSNYKITYNLNKENNISTGIYFQYQNKKSIIMHSSISHDFELFFYEKVLE